MTVSVRGDATVYNSGLINLKKVGVMWHHVITLSVPAPSLSFSYWVVLHPKLNFFKLLYLCNAPCAWHSSPFYWDAFIIVVGLINWEEIFESRSSYCNLKIVSFQVSLANAMQQYSESVDTKALIKRAFNKLTKENI